MVGIEGRAQVGGLGLFLEADHFTGTADFHHPEARHFIRTNGQSREGDVGAGIIVVLEHQPVVHFVNVVAGKNQHMLRLFRADGVDVLVNRVRGAHVPIGADPLHGRQDLNELAQFLGHDTGPAFADVAVERERFVLGEDVDPAQVGVDAVGEGDIDNAVVAAEGNRRFGPISCQGEKPFTRSPGQQYSKCVFHSVTAAPVLTLSLEVRCCAFSLLQRRCAGSAESVHPAH